MSELLVEAKSLVVTYRSHRGSAVRAVDDVDLEVRRGHTLGLVGESGSGKSSIGSVLLGLIEADSGTVAFDGVPMRRGNRAERAALARRVQVVFQDPYGSFNPARTIGESLAEAPRYTLGLSHKQIRSRLEEVLADVGMGVDALDRYPTQFSGGQLQRLAIARALAMQPEFIVCDEAVSALDLSVQAQVINVLARLARDKGLAYLFISHDLSVVRHISDEIIVLFAGQVMERGPAELIASRPAHPYSRSLVLAAPVPDPREQAQRRAERQSLPVRSTQPSAPEGCPFASRCPYVIDICQTVRPRLERRSEARSVACHRYDEINAVTSAEVRGA